MLFMGVPVKAQTQMLDMLSMSDGVHGDTWNWDWDILDDAVVKLGGTCLFGADWDRKVNWPIEHMKMSSGVT
jgi:hypothetical protein